jgi:tetratricopeptide (TPR) repeat protein
MREGKTAEAVEAFERAVQTNRDDSTAHEHLMLANFAAGQRETMWRYRLYVADHPTALVPRALLALDDDETMRQFAQYARAFVGEDEFELLETALIFADLGLFDAASRIVQASCIDPVPKAEQGCLPSYYLAWFATQQGDTEAAEHWLTHAAETGRENEYASRSIEVEILQHAIEANSRDARAHLQLGCLLAHLGRVEAATAAWQKAVDLDANQSVGWRNLGLAAASRSDLPSAEAFYRKAIAARPDDQTLYRDLAEILIADQRRSEAIACLEQMPRTSTRRAEITVMLAEAYMAENRDEDCIQLLESTPYFVNWEGQDVTWRLFHDAHLQRGQRRLKNGDAAAALADFTAALTYPENLNVGRSNKPQEACAQYWRGQALSALGRAKEARAAWQTGADGADVEGRQNEFRQKCREALAQSSP